MDVVLWIPRSVVMIFDVMRLDFDVTVVDLWVVIIVCTSVTIFHFLS